jgi:K+-transporting ATPase KdpF subunit
VIGSRENAMGIIELVGLVIAAGLLIYLTFALLKPEWFA